jgi:hypothetical protein
VAPDRSGHADEFTPRLKQIADFVANDPAHARQIDELVTTTIFPRFIHAMTHMNDVGNGWRSTGNRTGFGNDYQFRAIANFGGIWWNSATEVIYYPLQADQTGQLPTGDHTYTIQFAAGGSPGEHVDELLVDHALHRAIVMRLYLPKPEVLGGSWTPPPMTTQT